MGRFLVGASYPLRALGVLGRTPGLWPYVAAPIAINIALGAALYGVGLLAGMRAIDRLLSDLPELPAWAAAFALLLRALLVVGLLLATGFVLARFGVVLGAPWYGALSARLEGLRTGGAPAAGPGPRAVGGPGGLGGALVDLGRAARYELQKLLLVVAASAVLLPMNLVPGVGTAAAGLGAVALGATVACLDFFDAPLERRRLGFRQKLRVVRRGLPASAGFGLVCLVLAGVPFLNLVTMPLCVAAGTLFFCDRLARDLPPARTVARTRS